MSSDNKVPTVLAISGSHRNPSFTEKMLDTLLSGLGEADVRKFYPHKMNIGPCTSCWSCWIGKNKGECIQKDDFQQIYDIYKKCDYFILAAPVYVFGYPATVKNVIDRTFVNLKPTQIVMENGLTNHPQRHTPKGKAVLVSSCGFPDMENFELISQHFKKWMSHGSLKWAGEVLIPAAGAANVPRLFNDNLEAIKQAGRELVEDELSVETMGRICDIPMSKEDYREMSNASFRGGIAGRARATAIGINALRKKKK